MAIEVLPVITSFISIFTQFLGWFDTLSFMVGGVTVTVMDLICGFMVAGSIFNLIWKLISPEGKMEEGLGNPLDFWWSYNDGDDDDEED